MKDKALERFIKYAKIDTQSDDQSETTPSTMKQYDLAKVLVEDLAELGIKAEIDEFCRVYAHLEGEEGLPAIGVNAHMDTALETSGKDVKPRVIEKYDGGTIKLNDKYSMSPEDFPILNDFIGDGLVVTDGTTLLGCDDKAGDAIIMAALDYFVHHPEVKHHPISILFTPDEEIGRGPEHFNRERFGAEWAYTIDGAHPDIIEIENFNAAHADIEIEGFIVHPGEAKGKLVNALTVAREFDSLLDANERPEFTDGHDGFNLLNTLNGTSDSCSMHYIIRNHDRALLEKQKQEFKNAQEYLLKKYPKARINLKIEDDYKNMLEVFRKDDRAVKHVVKAFENLNLKYRFEPIRGGTDGATFSFLGCPCPNLGTGSYNHHGRFEFLNIREFHQMIDLVIEILKA